MPPLSFTKLCIYLLSTYLQQRLSTTALQSRIATKSARVITGPIFSDTALKPTAGSSASRTPALKVSLARM